MAIRTYGPNAVDWEARVDVDRLRTDRLDRLRQHLDASELGSLLNEKTKILSVTGMSNALGTITPLGQLIEAAHAVGAHRIATRPFTGHVRVERGGRVLAASDRAVALEETGLPTRFYLPRDDVRMDLLVPSATVTHSRRASIAVRIRASVHSGWSRITYFAIPIGSSMRMHP
jgi:hypothetical protein